jgi:hypothetical protein
VAARWLLLTVRPARSGPATPGCSRPVPGLGRPDRRPGAVRAARRHGAGTVEVEPAAGTFAVQGGWWYRGEWTVEPDPAGTRISHRVRNAARTGRWAVPLANLGFVGFRTRTEAELRLLMDRIRAELGEAEPPVEGSLNP